MASIQDEEASDSKTANAALRRSEREPKLTEKMKLYKEELAAKAQRSDHNSNQEEAQADKHDSLNNSTFSATYETWKKGMNSVRSQLKNQLSEQQLTAFIDTVEELHNCVVSSYQSLPIPVDPVLRRQMDSCSANTRNLIELAQLRMSEVGYQPWEEVNEKARLRMMLDTDYAKSVYSSRSSRSSASYKPSLSSHSQSQASSSSRASIASKRAEAVAKLAAKEAELGIIQEKTRLEAQLQQLEAEKEIKMAKAMIAVYDEELDQPKSDTKMPRCTGQMLNPNAKPFQQLSSPSVTDENQNQLLSDNLSALNRALQTSLDYNNLPVREPPTFSGDPLSFIKWKRSFENLIGQKNIRASDKLALLERYVTSEAAECIDGMFYRTDEDAYKEAWGMLNERYGHPSVLLAAFRTKLTSWPKIGPKEYTQLRKFADFLVAIDSASTHIPGLKNLNDIEENRKLLLKLPDWLITKWGSLVAEHDDKGLDYPNFHEFCKFLTTQAKIATRPVCSLQALKGDIQERKPTPFVARGRNQAVVMAIEADHSQDLTQKRTIHGHPQVTSTAQQPGNMPKYCVFCKAPTHYLPNCPTFQAKSLDERRTFVKEEKRCFKCLKTGHGAKSCKAPHTCKVCKGKHPSALHDDNFQKNVKAITEERKTSFKIDSNCNEFSSSSVTLPVWVSTKNDPHNEKLVYALIDTQSDTTFIDQSVANSLNVPAKETTRLKIDTIKDGSSPTVVCEKVPDLRVRSYRGNTFIDLPLAYTVSHIPLNSSSIPTCNTAKNWAHLRPIAKELPPLLNCEPGILIGYDCSQAFLPREYLVGEDSEPFAVKTDLGWSIIGRTSPNVSNEERSKTCSRIITKELPIITPTDACRVLEKDFHQDENDGKTASQEDKLFISTLSKTIKTDEDGHLQMPLPFRKETPSLPNNYGLASKRLDHLKRKLQQKKDYYQEYCNFMKEILERGDAEEAHGERKGHEWYIPHHGVYHPQKKKLRVVFDCSAKFSNTSLNDHLLVGPNLINNLVGILCRFRKYPVAFTCDIEKMFHQFRVAEGHRDFLRFLWWKDGDLTQQPTAYRMKVHLFGAASSPGCANFGLKHLAKENSNEYPEGSKFIQEDFYMDDGLSSLPSEEQASNLIKQATDICKKGGLRLHKFTSNSPKVMETVPISERATALQTFDLSFDDIPIERTLGMQWSVESDTLHFSFSPADRPITRRGILAVVASLYDPLGLIAPFVLTGKQILQEVCNKGTRWDDPVPSELLFQWKTWTADFEKLKELSIPRCYYPTNFGNITKIQLHHFADASQKGYGMCSYLRVVNDASQVHCSLIAAKARVAPRKVISIPRLELTAALVAAEVGSMVRKELKFKADEEFFWTDSQVVLGYINNEAKKFHVFVANRVQKIRDLTDLHQWHHVATEKNPADFTSRGLKVSELQQSMWFSGPRFLWESKIELPTTVTPELRSEDPEVRISLKTQVKSCPLNLNARLAHISDWTVAARIIARIMKLTHPQTKEPSLALIKEEVQRAKEVIIRNTQAQYLSAEISRLSAGSTIPKGNRLYQAEPFLQDGILRIGGRLKNGDFSMSEKHPIILPKDCHVTKLVITHCHKRVKHQGRGTTLNEVRSQGFWIQGGSRQVAKILHRCVLCRKLRGKVLEQHMAELPKERIEPSLPFTSVGMDCFGPILVRNGRKEVKRYGLLFTCFCSRGIHLEMLDDLSTDSFINGLRCFIAIRGAVHKVFCDQGTNFVGADNELKKTIKEMDKVSQHFQDQLTFVFNAPHASHAGGVWERQIRTVKSILTATTALCPGRLDDSSLRALLYETMAIVNSRPITAVHQGDPTSPEPLTPNHILTMKPNIPLPPPGHFMKEDLYLRKRWRRVQYLTQQFWSRWRKEYVSSLIQRQKWLHPRRNLRVGDVVLVVDQDLPRSQWRLGQVTAAPQDQDGLVRRVQLKTATRNLDNKGKRKGEMTVLERPIQKLVLILESE